MTNEQRARRALAALVAYLRADAGALGAEPADASDNYSAEAIAEAYGDFVTDGLHLLRQMGATGEHVHAVIEVAVSAWETEAHCSACGESVASDSDEFADGLDPMFVSLELCERENLLS